MPKCEIRLCSADATIKQKVARDKDGKDIVEIDVCPGHDLSVRGVSNIDLPPRAQSDEIKFNPKAPPFGSPELAVALMEMMGRS